MSRGWRVSGGGENPRLGHIRGWRVSEDERCPGVEGIRGVEGRLTHLLARIMFLSASPSAAAPNVGTSVACQTQTSHVSARCKSRIQTVHVSHDERTLLHTMHGSIRQKALLEMVETSAASPSSQFHFLRSNNNYSEQPSDYRQLSIFDKHHALTDSMGDPSLATPILSHSSRALARLGSAWPCEGQCGPPKSSCGKDNGEQLLQVNTLTTFD